MKSDRAVTFVVEPGKVYSLEVLGADLSGSFRVFSTGAKRIKGKRSWWARGEIIESGERVSIRFTETERP